MNFNIERIIIKNRAPFKNDLDLSFKKNGIIVLTGINGKGKTTILSYIVDAWIEITREKYSKSYKSKETDYYRISSRLFDINTNETSLVYIRFGKDDSHFDYIDIRNRCSEEKYDSLVPIEDKISYSCFSHEFNENGVAKRISQNLSLQEIKAIWDSNVITYFPSYRYELPSYLNKSYEIKNPFNLNDRYVNELTNPLEVVSDITELSGWLMDIVLDGELYKQRVIENNQEIDITPENNVWRNLCKILQNALFSKYPDKNVRFAIGKRNNGKARISIYDTINNKTLCPSIFNLSTGELSIIGIFGELLRQADNLNNGADLHNIRGIVLIDEVDKHLHIKLQKEVLPLMFDMFPNVQFIISSHSPFLNMGLADKCLTRSSIIDLDNNGLIVSPTNNNIYQEAYSIFLNERNNYAEELMKIKSHLASLTRPLVITEGKTDIKHILNAMNKLGIERRFDILNEEDQPEGCSNLDSLIKNISKNKAISQTYKVIAIFDRDIQHYVNEYPDPYTLLGNNTYAFCIKCPDSRINENRTKISIEYLYSDEEIHQKLPNGTQLFFGNEFEKNSTRRCKSNPSLRLNDKNGVGEDRILENNGGQAVYDENFINFLAKKNEFVESIINEDISISKESIENFRPIIDIINEIIDL